ncbi:hypothetical protein C0J50_10774, partial [Silurus asotus]
MNAAAELVALTRACQLSESKVVTIYTDSKSAYGVVHDFAKTWKQRNFKTADGKPIAHFNLIGDLFKAVQLPAKVAKVKVKGHAAGDSEEVQGNTLADKVAKEAAKQPVDLDTIHTNPEISMMSHISNIPDIDLKIHQSQPTEDDIKYWASKQCKSDSAAIIRDVDGKIALPKLALIVLVKHYHGMSHIGIAKVIQAINALYCIADVAKTRGGK